MAKNVLTDKFSEPLNSVATAKFEINAGDGNLTIDRITDGEQMLASGTLQYLEKQGPPTRALVSSNDQATLTLRGSAVGQPWFRFPWAACNGATEWQIHLNPTVSSDITARSDGGNLKLNLAGMSITRVSADTGGGNMMWFCLRTLPTLALLPGRVRAMWTYTSRMAWRLAFTLPLGWEK